MPRHPIPATVPPWKPRAYVPGRKPLRHPRAGGKIRDLAHGALRQQFEEELLAKSV